MINVAKFTKTDDNNIESSTNYRTNRLINDLNSDRNHLNCTFDVRQVLIAAYTVCQSSENYPPYLLTIAIEIFSAC